jgi:hypothetical protein
LNYQAQAPKLHPGEPKPLISERKPEQKVSFFKENLIQQDYKMKRSDSFYLKVLKQNSKTMIEKKKTIVK